MAHKTLEELLVDLTAGEKVRVVQQNKTKITNTVADSLGSLSDRLRGSMDNLIARSKPKVGLIASMVVGAGVIAGAGFGLSNVNLDNITLSKGETPTTQATVVVKDSGTEVASTGLFDSLKSQISSVAKTVSAPTENFPILNTSHGKFNISEDLQKSLEESAQFSIPANFKPNQISRFIAQEKFKSAQENKTMVDYLASLLSEGEGFRENLYRDNIGLAYGIGWNVSMQSPEFNKFLMSAVNSNPQAINKIVSFSKTPMAYPPGRYGDADTAMPPQRHMQASLLIAHKFMDGGVLPAFTKFAKQSSVAKEQQKQSGESWDVFAKKRFNTLDPFVQAALVYHSYKVGEAGFGRYLTLNKKVIDYAFTPLEKRTLEQRTDISKGVVYNYRLNGESLRDTRAEMKVAAMLVNPEIYGSMIKSNPAPQNIHYQLPQLKTNGVVVPTNMKDEFVIPNKLGELKEDALNNGKTFNPQMQYNYSDMNYDAPAPKPRKKGGMPAWG